MDVYTFVESLVGGGDLKTAPQLPGNSNPSYAAPNPLNPSTNMTVGPNVSDSSWSGWLSTAKNIIGAPVRLVEGAWSSFENASSSATNVVKTGIDNAVSSVTGTVGILKWVVVGLVAFAIIYGLFLVAPFLTPITNAIGASGKQGAK